MISDSVHGHNADYSSGTVRDSHPVPILISTIENLLRVQR